YVDKIGRYYFRAHPHLSLGSTLHGVLRSFHEEGAVQTAEELAVRVEESWVSAGFDSQQQESEYRTAGIGMIQAYREAHVERAAAEVETILAERQIKTDMGAFFLAGRIDRVDRHPDGSIEVVDYKSGRLEVTLEDVSSSLAMNIYQLILQRLYPEARVFGTIYCLRSGCQA